MVKYIKFLSSTYLHKINSYIFMLVPLLFFTVFLQLQYWVLRKFNYYSLIDGYFLGRTIISVIIGALMSFWLVNHTFTSPINDSNELSILTKVSRKDIILGKLIFMGVVILVYWLLFLFIVSLNAMIGELYASHLSIILKYSFLYSLGLLIGMVIFTLFFSVISLYMRGKVFRVMISVGMGIVPVFALVSVLTKVYRQSSEKSVINQVLYNTVFTIDSETNLNSYIIDGENWIDGDYKNYSNSRNFTHWFNISNHFDLFNYIGIDEKVLSNKRMKLTSVSLTDDQIENQFYRVNNAYYAIHLNRNIFANIHPYWYESFYEELNKHMTTGPIEDQQRFKEQFEELPLVERLISLTVAFEKFFNNEKNVFDFTLKDLTEEFDVYQLDQVALVTYRKLCNESSPSWFTDAKSLAHFNWKDHITFTKVNNNLYKLSYSEWTPTWFVILFYITVISSGITLAISRYKKFSFR